MSYLESGFKIILILFISLNGFTICQANSEKMTVDTTACSIDLNDDNQIDLVTLQFVSKKLVLQALIQGTSSYEKIVLEEMPQEMGVFVLSCHLGDRVTSTNAGAGENNSNIYVTNGAYIKLTQLESSQAAYFWKDKKFKKIWIAD